MAKRKKLYTKSARKKEEKKVSFEGLPPIAYILMAFAFLSFVVFAYSQASVQELPEPVSPWQIVKKVRDQISRREIFPEEGRERRVSLPPYQVIVVRLKNLTEPRNIGRFIIRVRSDRKLPYGGSWFGGGLDVGFVDQEPSAINGELQTVAFRYRDSDVDWK